MHTHTARAQPNLHNDATTLPLHYDSPMHGECASVQRRISITLSIFFLCVPSILFPHRFTDLPPLASINTNNIPKRRAHTQQPPRKKTPSDGFGVVIATVAMKGSAHIVIVDEGGGKMLCVDAHI
jgi:hypothetical protein